MQFVANGPEIPESLLQAHEEGRVAFFCGAGISYPAGLPGFKGLVDAIYRLVGTTLSPIERDAYDRDKFDATLDLLEHRLPGSRLAVRTALASALRPNLRLKGAKDNHAALLQLARNRKGALRLITTNFDCIFARLTARVKPSVAAFPAPLLPIPKASRWDGLVYLHGLLPEHPDESALNRLVITSGDFGIAYLTERWAARFVSELFRNFIVCFVGYSINDPVLRYMMDALAADRMLGEATPQAYAFGDCAPGQESRASVEWEAKGVESILYEVPIGTNDHSALYRTLKTWAEIYRDGIQGKEHIVGEYAMARPTSSTKQDDYVGRMLWALSDKTGLPAKLFADFEPVPSLDWLEVLSNECFHHTDLSRFGVPPNAEGDDKLQFSLVRRPAPYTHSPWMQLVSIGASDSRWDEVMQYIAHWLARHLDDPELLLWIVQRGGQMHDRLAWSIERNLNKFARLELEGDTDELARIRNHTPNAIPRPLLRLVWRLLLTGRVKSSWSSANLYQWKDRFNREGLTATLRLELRELLTPKVMLKRPFRWGMNESENQAPERLKQIIDWEMVLAADHVHSALFDLKKSKDWRNALPMLIEDFQLLLRDALDLMSELGEADDRTDPSKWDIPSISDHWQNRFFKDWVTLIELMREAWLVVRTKDPARAIQFAHAWFSAPYPAFKRLALFAASQNGCVEPDHWVDWLSSNDAWWLWSFETMRETLRLLVLQGLHLAPQARKRLEAAILAGPPREMFKDDLELESWQDLVIRLTWLRLAKLQKSGAELGILAANRLRELSAARSGWQLEKNESDEFSHWLSGTGDPDFEANRVIEVAPQERGELVEWLKRTKPTRHPFYLDTWAKNCRENFHDSALALYDLALEDQWLVGRWKEALQVWSEEGLVLQSWQFIAPRIHIMPDEVLKEILNVFTWWLKAVSKLLNSHQEVFLELCRRIVELPYQDEMSDDQPVGRALNHPIGQVTQAILEMWLKGAPNDGDGLSDEIEPIFTRLCDTRIVHFLHGRVLLASRLIALFRIDQHWTTERLLPLFDWTKDATEARAVWEGFLWSPRVYHPLFIAIKVQFLDTANHYDKLGEFAQQFATLLTFAALDTLDTYTPQEFQTALVALQPKGLEDSAQALVRALEGAGEQREQYWVNRIHPFWQAIWPKSIELISNSIAESLARLSIAAGNQFPNALVDVLAWLRPIEHPDFVVRQIHNAGFPVQFPNETLTFLDAIIENQPWSPSDLVNCLAEISKKAPDLLRDHRYQKLADFLRQRET